MRVVAEQDPRYAAWLQERIGVPLRPDLRVIAQLRGDTIAAVVGFDNFSAKDCFMHVASDGSRRWLSRALLIEAFHYPFAVCNLNRVTGMVAADNAEAIAFDLKLGFVKEGFHPYAGSGGEHLVSLGLLRDRCLFIPKELRHV